MRRLSPAWLPGPGKPIPLGYNTYCLRSRQQLDHMARSLRYAKTELGLGVRAHA